MDNQQTNNTNDVKKYLVTEGIDVTQISQDQKNDDLEFLNKAEQKADYQVDISKGIENPALSRAMKALRLVNPFKGY